MPNPENIEKHQFTSKNQPEKRQSRKGSKNRATILEKYLKAKIKFSNKNPRTGEKIFESLDEDILIPVSDRVMLALIGEALKGNINAIREIQDTQFGKITEKQEIDATIEANHYHRLVDDLVTNYGTGDPNTDRD